MNNNIYNRLGVVQLEIHNKIIAAYQVQLQELKEKIQILEQEKDREVEFSAKLQKGFELAMAELPDCNVPKEKKLAGYWISQVDIRQKIQDSQLLYQEPNFDSIIKLDNRAIQTILRQDIDNRELAIALMGANKDLQNIIFSNLSKRLGAMIKEDMDYMGPVRQSDINEARIKISKIIRKLIDAGTIVFKEADVIVTNNQVYTEGPNGF